MNEKNEYCTGCGLCNYIYREDVEIINEKGFDYFYVSEENMSHLKKNICMSSGIQTKDYSGELWGESLNTVLSWSKNEKIRYEGSSGGTLTSLACYMLDKKIVDGILHISLSKDSSTNYEYIVTSKSDELINYAGSKYIDTKNLSKILDLIQDEKKYCFIGKPCDVITLKNYSKFNEKLKKSIIVYLSFFCAGSPSVKATYDLAKSLGCDKELSKINYRGNGWPGITTISDIEGKTYTTTYDNSWGNYLGRNIRKCCRFCLDGIGEAADIACADAWFVKDGKPDFSEHDGRNIIFSRSELGNEIFEGAVEEGYLSIEKIDNVSNYLEKIQKYQFQRRVTMKSVLSALKLFGRTVPSYDKRLVKKYSKNASFKLKIKRYLGTVKRVLNKRI